MPTYEYVCEKCGKVFDHFQSMSSAALTTCPPEVCPDAGPVKRQVGAGSGLIFKGSGFYITDYKKQATSPADGAAKSDASGGGESKPAAAPATESKPAAPAPSAAPSSDKSA